MSTSIYLQGKSSYVLSTVLVLFALLSAGGCSMGPKQLKANRFDYNVMLQKSKSQEIVLNIVRARYWEPPFFLQVGSISSTFGYSYNLGAAASFSRNLRNMAPGVDTYSPSLGTSISRRPTLTYSPLQGEKAIRQLQTEMSLEHFLILTRIGFNIESLAWTAIARIGDLHNYDVNRPASKENLANYEKFLDLAHLLREMQMRDDLEFTAIGQEGGSQSGIKMQLRCLDKGEVRQIEDLLGVEPERIALSDGTFVLPLELTSVRDLAAQASQADQGAGEYARVPVRLKSFFQILYDLSGYVQATSREEQKRIARPHTPLKGELASRQGLHSGLIKIKSASAPPKDAYVAINYRDRHYYIPDSDLNSKAYLMLIESIFSLLSGDVQSVTPLITIPVGG